SPAAGRGFVTTRARARSGLRELDDLAERRRILHGEIGQHLAVETDLVRVQRRDEARVADAVLATRSVDALDPETAKIPLAQLAAREGVLPGAVEDVERLAVAVLAPSEEAFDLLEDSLVATAWAGAPFYARHIPILTDELNAEPKARQLN